MSYNNPDHISYMSIDAYEKMISDIFSRRNTYHYKQEYLAYIDYNQNLESKIQDKIILSKKYFNAILKSKIEVLSLITEPWCLDACILLPLIRSILIVKADLEVRIYLRDQNEELMNQFLTNGGKSIPIVFGLKQCGEKIFQWGPRTSYAAELAFKHKDEDYAVKQKVLSEYYISNCTMEIQEEWINLV